MGDSEDEFLRKNRTKKLITSGYPGTNQNTSCAAFKQYLDDFLREMLIKSESLPCIHPIYDKMAISNINVTLVSGTVTKLRKKYGQSVNTTIRSAGKIN
jgi:hypothetical protein